MTYTSTTPPARSQSPARPGSRRDLAFVVLVVAAGVGLLHALDDAVFGRQPGVPVSRHLPALLVVTALVAVALLVFRRVGTGLRAVLALTVGAVTLVNGALHVIHVAVDEPSGSDLSGVLAAVAGAVLVGMSVVLPSLHRGERGLPPVRRWAVRVAAVAVAAVVVQVGVVPIGVGIVKTHTYREPIGAPPDARFASVSFDSSDGLELSGWYAASRNGAAVLVVNTASGDRLGSVRHAELLVDHGYGVLLYDARGSGDSEGTPNGYGWDWERDVDGALDFLGRRPEVDPGRLGALGLSTGADVLIDVAARDRRVGAVVADGATARSLADLPPGTVVDRVLMAPVMATVRLVTGSEPGPSLASLAPRISPTPLLLIACGSLPGEIDMNIIYAEAAREPVDLWTLPGVRHTRAIHEVAAEYERRVIGHFDRALLR